ncbi:MAG: SpoIID/LytB domain-containing protein [Cyanobacteriota bacterium]|nr:SpoIID/LytB domain-containing protein [Cyanobacteriota bacterium]
MGMNNAIASSYMKSLNKCYTSFPPSPSPPVPPSIIRSKHLNSISSRSGVARIYGFCCAVFQGVSIGRTAALTLFWAAIAIAPVSAAVDLRVSVKQGVNGLAVGGSTAAKVRDETGQQVGTIPAGDAYTARSGGGNVRVGNWQGRQLWVEPEGQGAVWIGDRWYRGDVRLVPQSGGLAAINHVDLEEYLYSVVGAEAIASWPLEALKAQAVAARSYALYKRAESPNDLYDVGTTTATQVYKGLESEASSTVQAVRETAGEVVVYGGQVALTAYHSSSGGHTENVEDVWSSPLPYLRGVPDYDQNAPVYQWSLFFSTADLSRRLGGVGTIRQMTPERTTPRGRVVAMAVVGDGGTTRVTGAQVQRALGLRSRLFSVTATGSGFQVQGRGFGHGVGMSQWGAKAMADRGLSYRQILGHYYQNAGLSRLGE